MIDGRYLSIYENNRPCRAGFKTVDGLKKGVPDRWLPVPPDVWIFLDQIRIEHEQRGISTDCPWYAASKEAIRGLSRCAAREWGPDNIRVNVVCPGCMTDTIQEVGFAPVVEKMSETIPLKRCGDAYKDITPSYVFLASDEAQFITGQTLAVDGGFAILP